MRPLRELELRCNVTWSLLPHGPDGTVDPGSVPAAIRRDTRLVIVNHQSNVNGAVQPVAAIKALARSIVIDPGHPDAWNNVGFAGAEIKNPERDIPFAMSVGVLAVVVLYVMANVAYVNVLPADTIATG